MLANYKFKWQRKRGQSQAHHSHPKDYTVHTHRPCVYCIDSQRMNRWNETTTAFVGAIFSYPSECHWISQTRVRSKQNSFLHFSFCSASPSPLDASFVWIQIVPQWRWWFISRCSVVALQTTYSHCWCKMWKRNLILNLFIEKLVYGAHRLAQTEWHSISFHNRICAFWLRYFYFNFFSIFLWFV